MPLDGLRAWIAEVERKLGMRTRVFLVLTTIAIGGAGAAIYLAIDTRDNTVSKSDVEALERTSDTGSEVESLEAKLQALQAQIQTLQSSEEAPAEESGGENGNGNAETQGDTGGGGGAAVPKTQQEPVKPQKEPPEETGKPQETKKAG
jgi:TolA-binding protein